MDYRQNPHGRKGIDRLRKDGSGRSKIGHWYFEADKHNAEETNKLLNEMAQKYCYQHKLISRLTKIIIVFGPIFAILEMWDFMQLLGIIVRAMGL